MNRAREDIRAANITRANYLDEGGDPKRCPPHFPTSPPEPAQESGSGELEGLRREVADLRHEAAGLRELVAPLLRRAYGGRSEGRPAQKPGMLLGEGQEKS